VAKSFKAPLVAWLACAGGLVLLALVVYGVDGAQRLDATLLAKFIAHRGSDAGSFVSGLAHLGDPLPVLLGLALACGIALQRGRPRDAAAALTVVAGANLTAQVLKVLLAHPRFQPVLGHDQLEAASFPSGHVTAVASVAIAFAFVVPSSLRPLVAFLGCCLVAGVGCGVLVLDWHAPSDVLGGILVAAGWGFAVLAVLRYADAPAPGQTPQIASRSPISVK
jgi:membrane-associated phospholipid phosphatase